MRESAKRHLVLKKLPLFLAVAGCLYGTTALAQDAQGEEVEPEQQTTVPAETTELETVVVTAARSELPIVLDFAFSKYGGSSSSTISSGSPFSRLVQAVCPGACSGE